MSEKGRIRRAGQSITQWWTETAQDVVDFLEALLRLEVSPAGIGKLVVSRARIILQLDPKAIAELAEYPLEPFNSSDAGGLKVSIRWGTVGGLELNSYGPVAISATTYFFARVTTNSAGTMTGRTLHHQAGAGFTNSDTVFYLLLGRAVVSGGTITAVERALSGSVSFQRCGYAGNYTVHFDHV